MRILISIICLLGVIACTPCDTYQGTVKKVLACGMEECRVLLSNNTRMTVHNIVVEGDLICGNRKRSWVCRHCKKAPQ